MGFNWGHDLMDVLALAVVGVILRELVISKGRGDSESTSRTNDGSGEENEALRRDSESTSRTDNLVGEEYDVFLSFRGSDTRLNFTDHLYHSMVRVGIRVFLDSEELEDGKKISEVLNAVNKSRIYIPIFSQNYASSIWCLREVKCMVDCHSEPNGKKEIIPIFYDVEADDVKLRTYLYRKAIGEHKRNFFSFLGLNHKGKFDSSEVQQWENALKTVGKIKGRELKGQREAGQIESIVEEVSRKINIRHMIETENLVEDNAQVADIMKLLDVGYDGVRFIGIHGTGGIGKTTLAKVIFNKLSFQFESCCFLEDVRASSQPHDGILNLQKKLLSGFVSLEIINQIKDVGGGIMMIKKVFSNKKVIIILDDLDKKEQLQNLAGKSDWFHPGSRIIITTREESILNTQTDQIEGILPYEVRLMSSGLALHLFYKHAFRSDFTVKEYEKYAEKIVTKVGKLPLAVAVIGSHLFNLGNHLSNSYKKEVWDETLGKLEKGLFDDVHDVRDTLMLSYERLNDNEKEVFLDIACFFTNDNSTYPFIMWKDCGYYPHSTTGVLSQKSLIKIRDDNKFWMHDQVRDFGRDIVLRKDPHKICRVWNHEKVLELLEPKKRNEDVKAMSLMFDGHDFTQEELACLPKLRFLRVKEPNFSGNFENLLSELRWLSWQTWKMTFHANNFHFCNLVVLDLSDSNIGDGWDGWSQMKMNKLKVLDLTGCIRLKTTPDFSNFTSLEKLILTRCVQLITIDSSIGKLKLLKALNMKGCRSLGKLPIEVGSLKALTEITMPRNFQPLNLPETFGNLESLLSLILDEHHGITRLPGSIGRLVTLGHLSLCGCVGIKKLPPSIGDLKMLVELDISRTGIIELPDSIGKLGKLKVLRISYTKIRKFPHTIAGMNMLEELHVKKCWFLTGENLEEIGKLSLLRILDLSYTLLSRFPPVLGCLSCLHTLELGSSHLQEVPDLPPSLTSLTRLHLQARHFPSNLDLSSLISLNYLELSRLVDSTEEPPPNDSPVEQLIHPLPSGLSALTFNGINLLPCFSNLKNLSVLCVREYPMSCFCVPQDLIHLKELRISKCKLLVEILGLSLLKNLQRLDLNRLTSLTEIQGLSELNSLSSFRISHCLSMEWLPNLSKLDKLQHIEIEDCPRLKAIELINGSESLKWDNGHCTILERLLDVSMSTWLSRRAPRCQVILSFSGLDAPYGIVGALYNNLVRNRILVFLEEDDLSSGDENDEELLLADDPFTVYVPFLSKNYASSWRLLKKLARRKERWTRILPILYEVKIDDIWLDSDLYRSALDKHRRTFDTEVDQWQVALLEIAESSSEEGERTTARTQRLMTAITQMLTTAITRRLTTARTRPLTLNSNRYAAARTRRLTLNSNSCGEQIERAVKEVLGQLRGEVVLPSTLVKDHPQIKAIIEKLDVDSDGVRYVGIHGMAGIGKTILAKIVFNELLHQFDGVCFLDVQTISPNLEALQEKLVHQVLSSEDVVQIKDIDHGMDQIKRGCSTKKVLIVLDGLDKKEQLKSLAGESIWFGSGSRILITTRDKSILTTEVESSRKEFLTQPKEILVHEFHKMEYDQALQLFCKHTFGIDSPIEGYDHLAKKYVHKLGMRPCAIESVGSYLRHYVGSYLRHYDHAMMIFKEVLMTLDDCYPNEIPHKLMPSYKGLENEEKEVFLDIACFFTNEDQTYPVIMWHYCNYHPHNAIDVLCRRSLIQIRDNKFWMHNLLRNLGRHIILGEEFGEQSRVWNDEHGLWLLERDKANGCNGDIALEDLAAQPNLRFLRARSIGRLSWQSMQTIHFSNLIMLDFSDSNIDDDWGGWSRMKMNKLRVLNLTGCLRLRRTLDFSNFESLEMLILAQCVNLTAIHPSIGRLKDLKILNIKGCSCLRELPADFSSLEYLKEIFMSQDSQLCNLPEKFGSLRRYG